MPIIVKQFSWHQSTAKISIDLPDIKNKSYDVFITPSYLKVSSPPYIFEAFFPHEINVEGSHAVKTENSLKIELSKLDPQLKWANLTLTDLTNDSAKEKRLEAQQWRAEYEASKSKQKLVAEREREKKATECSLEAYEDNRKRIQAEKAKSKAEFFKQPEFNTTLATKVAQEKERLASLPPIREQGVLSFQVCNRQFPAPKRESNKEQEEKWAKQQKEALEQKLAANFEHLDPMEIMAKAEQFFNLDDFESALEVYNYGVESWPKYAQMWNNRAAVHLKIGNYQQAIKDSSAALELLDPPVEANATMRAKALIRRGDFNLISNQS